MIRSVQPDDAWSWCYVDDRLYIPGDPRDEIPDEEGPTP